MSNAIPLKSCGYYVTGKVHTSKLSVLNYVTTDNLLQNKQGLVRAGSLPAQDGNVTAFKKGDVLIANIRPYLKKLWYAVQEGGCSADVLAIRASKKMDSKFLYYALFRDDFFTHVMNGSKGTKMPRGDKSQIMEFLIPNYQVDEQKKIAATLSVLDKKIELNNRINAELEAMAKTLYDYWFVQFDFPDANGKPYKTSGGNMVYNPTLKREIPERWEAVSIGNIVGIKTGKEDANFATESGKYHFFTCGESALRCDDFVFEGKAVLLAGNGSFSVKRFEGKFNAYQRTYVLIPKQDDLYSPLYFAVNDKVKTLTSGSRGSIVKFITKGDIEDIYLPLPMNRKLDFIETLNACFKESSRLYEQNLQLISLRNWLLPMLMNGQATVE